MKTSTIVLTGGGSGGHITPLLPLARALKKNQPDCKLVFIGHKGDRLASNTGNYFDRSYKINGGKFRRYHGESLLAHLVDVKTLVLNVRDFFRFIIAIFSSLRLIRSIKPTAVFSKGGFVAVPVCLAAKLCKVPIITHDSDAVPGLANRIIGRWAVVHATGMPKQFYNYPPQNTFFVGIPMPGEVVKVNAHQLASYKKQLGLPTDGLAILLTGGGNGSRKLNSLMASAAPRLLAEFPDLGIIHIAGLAHLNEVRQKYKDCLTADQLLRLKLFGFVDGLHTYSGAADIVVTRAGASSLAEFAVQAKACVVIPSPFLAAGHQLKNAQQLKKQAAALVLDESVSVDQFRSALEDLLNSSKRRAELANNLAALAKVDAADSLARLILAVAAGERVVDAVAI